MYVLLDCINHANSPNWPSGCTPPKEMKQGESSTHSTILRGKVAKPATSNDPVLANSVTIIALLPNPAVAPRIAAKLREMALLREAFAVLQATFRNAFARGT